jgi:dolichyl-phosphate-mannose-protein mannosyltransferase
VFLLFLTALSLHTRVFRIQFPREVTSEESRFGRIANGYLSGTYFFDRQPPLGAMLLAAGARLADYSGDFSFNTGDAYGSLFYVSMRFTSVLFSALVAPIGYFTLRHIL